MAEWRTLLSCDFETYHINDFKNDGRDIRIVGSEVHEFIGGEDTGRKPEVHIKCAGMAVYDLLRTEIVNGVPEISAEEQETHCDLTMNDFLLRILDYDKPVVVFHNLKFDESYIASAVLRAGGHLKIGGGWNVSCAKRLMGEQSKIYSATYVFRRKRIQRTVEFRDSAKIFRSSLRELGEMVGLEKGSDALTPGMSREIMEYCVQDCRIAGRAMIQYLNLIRRETFGRSKKGYMTSASTAYNLWIDRCMTVHGMTEGTYSMKLPKNGHPEWLRECYKGATPLMDPKVKWKLLEDVHVFDVNSMYPFMMANARLPYGAPENVSKKELYAANFWLRGYCWCAKAEIHGYVKEGHRPCFMTKEKNEHGEIVESVLDGVYCITDTDLKLIDENYDIDYFDLRGCYKYKLCQGVPKSFIEDWYKRKTESKKSNRSMYEFSKIILNSLYGKFGTNPEFTAYEYYLKEDGSMGVRETCEEESGKKGMAASLGYYLPWAVWITASGRYYLQKAINAVGWDHVAYTDTDSIHIHGMTREEAEERLHRAGFGTDPKKLGDFKYENECKIDAIYVRNKGYAHFHDGEIYAMHMAGANYYDRDGITPKTFSRDTEMNQIRGYHVIGGILLMDKRVEIDKLEIKEIERRRGMTPEESEAYGKWLFAEMWRDLGGEGTEDDAAFLEDVRFDESDPYWHRRSEWKQHREAVKKHYLETIKEEMNYAN